MITALLWGGNAVAGKFAVGHVSPMVLTMLRWAIALAVIAGFSWPHMKADRKVIGKNWLYLLAMGAIGYSAFNFFLYSAALYTSAINITLEQSAMPVIIFVLSFLIYRVRITGLQVLGYLLTVVGIIVTVSAGDPISFLSTSGSGINRGDILMFGAAIAYGGYSVALRSKPPMHWLSFLTCLIAAALLFSSIGALVEFQQTNAIFPMTTQGWLVVLFAGLFPSLLSQAFFIRGVEALGANAAGLYINLVPVFGALLAVALLGESLYIFHAVAFVLVVGGITMAQQSSKT